nr:hypothetical protein [Tanacetum cinerariifolium]
ELELLSGLLVASNCVEFLKKLQQCDQLKLMEMMKLIAAMHILVTRKNSLITLTRSELELLSGLLVASNCVEFLKKLQQCDQLKLMEMMKLIAAMHILVTRKNSLITLTRSL